MLTHAVPGTASVHSTCMQLQAHLLMEWDADLSTNRGAVTSSIHTSQQTSQGYNGVRPHGVGSCCNAPVTGTWLFASRVLSKEAMQHWTRSKVVAQLQPHAHPLFTHM